MEGKSTESKPTPPGMRTRASAKLSETIEIPIGDGVTTKVTVGGGGTISRISSEQARVIQRFADENGVRVAVVGSRASGEASAISDFDYIIEPLNRNIDSRP
jgi:hypothetical protein